MHNALECGGWYGFGSFDIGDQIGQVVFDIVDKAFLKFVQIHIAGF